MKITSKEKAYKGRLNNQYTTLKENYFRIYGEEANGHFEQLLSMMESKHHERKAALKKLDEEREGKAEWFLSEKQVGYMLYIDLFANNLAGLKKHIQYLHDLGVTYLHLMPFLEMPKTHNDGGYAVSSYTTVDERFGTTKELEEILDLCRELGMSVCSDFVINHTSHEHEWAKKAKQGIKEYQDMYFTYDTYDIPSYFESTVPEVFPKVAPGNFTYDEQMKRHVFTSFYSFQWDLNYQNPVVFNRIAENLLELANKGIEVFRLDAIPFMWKQLGTTCRNLPEIHTLIEMYRQIVTIVCPAVIFKGEAIVQPHEILSYFGGMEGKECNTMYNASLMVLLWNSLATRSARVAIDSLNKFPQIPKQSTWINYARCHDDIGWGFDEEVLHRYGLNPYHHQQFVLQFYKGVFPGTFARGEYYEFDEATGDGRTSGTLASLCGLEKALYERNSYEQELAEKRILLLHSIILAYSGIPVLYSGDEIAQLNDYNYVNLEGKGHDSRWIHRPSFDWEQAELRDDVRTTQGRVFNGIRERIFKRKQNRIFRSDAVAHPVHTNADSIFAFYKKEENEAFICLNNFSEYPVEVDMRAFEFHGLHGEFKEMFEERTVQTWDRIVVGPYQSLWFAQ